MVAQHSCFKGRPAQSNGSGPAREGRLREAAAGAREHAGIGEIGAARLRAILSEIDERASEPDFSIEDIARKLRVSGRYVRRLLQQTGKTFSEHKLDRKLDRAFELLTNPASKDLNITDVALMSGFGDVSHFNHRFRRRFGVTPTRARERADSACGS